MGLHIELDQEKHLLITVRGSFSCQISHAILDHVKAHWRVRSTPVHAFLGEVTESAPCASALLVSLVELLNGDFRLECCSTALEAAYVEALLKGTCLPDGFAQQHCCLPHSSGLADGV